MKSYRPDYALKVAVDVEVRRYAVGRDRHDVTDIR
jgi:hypothetical protein